MNPKCKYGDCGPVLYAFAHETMCYDHFVWAHGWVPFDHMKVGIANQYAEGVAA